jgi:hypothetical protein
MNLPIDEHALAEAIAEKVANALLANTTLIDRIVDAICLRFEILTPAETATLLDITTRTLGENHVKWGLDKSVAFGPQMPFYLLSQIIERLRAKVVKGSRLKEEERIAA